MQNKDTIKLEILALLKEAPTQNFIYIGSYFGDVDYFQLKDLSQEMFNQGLVKYDEKAWRNDQVALKITPEGMNFLRSHASEGDYDHKVRKWLQMGVLGGISIIAAIAIISSPLFINQKTPTGFRADISIEEEVKSDEALKFLQTHIENQGDDLNNYVVSQAASDDDKAHFIMVCKSGKTCQFASRYYILEEVDGVWGIVKKVRIDDLD